MKDEQLKSSVRTIDTAPNSATSLNSRGPLSVSFDSIEVREYPIQLGDNPCPCDGPSITIGWKAQRKKIFSVNYFESKRGERRTREELVIPSDARINLLQRHGVSAQAIDDAVQQSEEIRHQRTKSIANRQWDLVSATKESLGRKLKKTGVFVKKGIQKSTSIVA